MRLRPEVPSDSFAAINHCYQASASPVGFGLTQVTLPANLNVPALLPQYQELECMESASLGWVSGNTVWSPTPLPDGTWHWNVEFGMGDCPAGCTCFLHFDLEVTEAGVVTELSVDLVPPDCGPQLGCWWVPPCPPF
ncbi:MAG: hypothetical protein GY715_19395 [Planctomycetes bacterium]|nr:hypothetical protein [Planctomycetota bacterium]